MKYNWLDDYLMNKNGVIKDFKAEWGWFRYMVGGKMFVAVCMGENNKPYYITLKLEPVEGEYWRQQYEDVLPGYYMNKIHWNSIKPDGAVPDEILRDMVDKAYTLVFHSLPKKLQKEIISSSK